MCKANEKKVQKTFESETKHRSNFEPSLGCFCLDFLIFFFGQSSNSAPWLVSLCVHQAKQKNVKWLCKCWDATPAGCLRPDQRCKKKEKYIQTIFSLIWSFYTRKYNLPMQWFPRQFHAFQWRRPENINHSIWLFKLKISFDCRNVLDVFLLCEKLSSTTLTLHRYDTEYFLYSDLSNWNVGVYIWKNCFYFSGSGTWDCHVKQ